jgi:hypothetical protein
MEAWIYEDSSAPTNGRYHLPTDVNASKLSAIEAMYTIATHPSHDGHLSNLGDRRLYDVYQSTIQWHAFMCAKDRMYYSLCTLREKVFYNNFLPALNIVTFFLIHNPAI